MATPKYKRVLLKISGEAFCREGGHGIDIDEARSIARQIVEAQKTGTQVAVDFTQACPIPIVGR